MKYHLAKEPGPYRDRMAPMLCGLRLHESRIIGYTMSGNPKLVEIYMCKHCQRAASYGAPRYRAL